MNDNFDNMRNFVVIQFNNILKFETVMNCTLTQFGNFVKLGRV